MLSIALSASCCKTHKHGSMVNKEKTALKKESNSFSLMPTFLASNHQKNMCLRLGKIEALATVFKALLLANIALLPQPTHLVTEAITQQCCNDYEYYNYD